MLTTTPKGGSNATTRCVHVLFCIGIEWLRRATDAHSNPTYGDTRNAHGDTGAAHGDTGAAHRDIGASHRDIGASYRDIGAAHGHQGCADGNVRATNAGNQGRDVHLFRAIHVHAQG